MTHAALRRFDGRLIWPTDREFETARLVENAAFDAHPALIAKARHAGDVAAVVEYARSTGHSLAVRSGGHSVAGHSTGDGVVVLDLGAMNRLELDATRGSASAGPAVRAGDYTKLAFEHGLATSFGDTGTVGLGGLTVGGGIGWLVRKYGLTIDSLLAAEVVTADGARLLASPDTHPDLFWAVRGGGGNFGVVTRFELALRPIGKVLHGTIVMPASRDIVRQIVALGVAAPDDLTLMPVVMALPPMGGVPAGAAGRLGVFLDLVWAGPAEAGAAALAPFRTLGPVFADTVAEKPYPAVYPEPTRKRGGWISTGFFLDRFDEDTIEVLERHLSDTPDGECFVQFRILGGAAARVPADATAYGWRDRTLLLWVIADPRSPDRQGLRPHEEWVADLRAALDDYAAGGFAGFMAEDGAESTSTAYPPSTWTRLRQIKSRYDPDNLFRRNHNVPPVR